MTSTVTELKPRGGSRNEPPHLPAIARGPAEDAREALFAFDSKQSGHSDVPYADVAEDLAAALRVALAVLSRPPVKPVLKPLAILAVAQAEEMVMTLPARSRGADLPVAMLLLGRLSEHAQALLDVVSTYSRLP